MKTRQMAIANLNFKDYYKFWKIAKNKLYNNNDNK